jgi:hypothetical protein
VSRPLTAARKRLRRAAAEPPRPRLQRVGVVVLGVELAAPGVPLVLESVELLPVVPPVLPLVPGPPMEELLLPVPLPVVPAALPVLPVLPVPEPAVPPLPDGLDGLVVELDELEPGVPAWSLLLQAPSESAPATASVTIAS